jgi:hypothetical protein
MWQNRQRTTIAGYAQLVQRSGNKTLNLLASGQLGTQSAAATMVNDYSLLSPVACTYPLEPLSCTSKIVPYVARSHAMAV